jgi:hypothetical protein
VSNLWWLFFASAAVLGMLIAYRAIFARLKANSGDESSDTRYVKAKSLTRTRLLIDGAIAITALVTIVATALKALLM